MNTNSGLLYTFYGFGWCRFTSKLNSPLTDSQPEFWHLVKCQGCKELAHSLKMVHDLALYHSYIPFDAAEKSALFDLRVLWEGFEKMVAGV